MNKSLHELKPFMSLAIVFVTLFGVIFCKMEVRRVGYSVLKDSREYRGLEDNKRMFVIKYAQATNPIRLRKMALATLDLRDVEMDQIVQLSGSNIALKQ